jgi:hypothetical protein
VRGRIIVHEARKREFTVVLEKNAKIAKKNRFLGDSLKQNGSTTAL